jgi:hypothetical protein
MNTNTNTSANNIPVAEPIIIDMESQTTNLSDIVRCQKIINYRRTVKIFSAIDAFFNFIYAFFAWPLILVCVICYLGYYGAKKYLKCPTVLYFIYCTLSVGARIGLLYYLNIEDSSIFSIFLYWLALFVEVWIAIITGKFIYHLFHADPDDLEKLKKWRENIHPTAYVFI